MNDPRYRIGRAARYGARMNLFGVLAVVLAACLAFAIVAVTTAHGGLAVIAFLVVLLAGLYFGRDFRWERRR